MAHMDRDVDLPCTSAASLLSEAPLVSPGIFRGTTGTLQGGTAPIIRPFLDELPRDQLEEIERNSPVRLGR
jgi:hypothetical protein